METRPRYLSPRNLYVGQEATDRTGHETTDWFQIGKGVRQGCILSLCLFNLYVVFVQSLNRIQLFATPWTAGRQASLSITISQSLLKLMSVESVMPSNHLIGCCPLPSCLQSFPELGSFQMSQFFTSGGQSIGTSASASVFPMNIQG